MKNLLKILALALAIISCARNSSAYKNEWLTSNRWRLDAQLPDDQQREIITFGKDGKYSLESGNLKVNGKWSWKEGDEIYIMVDEIISDNGAVKFDKTSNYNIRILEIDNNALRFLEKGEGDTWDGGFAKEKKFTALKK